MHPDHNEYSRYMGQARFDKAINTLLGILHGIVLDSRIDEKEIALLENWIAENIEFRDRHPFNELIPTLESSLADGYLDSEEHLDIIWLCEKLRSTEYFDRVTADMQCLHGMLGGIIADHWVTAAELEGLSSWLSDNEHLRGCWPYDEVGSLVTSILADRKVSEQESRLLQHFCAQFLSNSGSRAIRQPAAALDENGTITGLCTVCPEVVFENSTFCFTGESQKYTRKQLFGIVEDLKGFSSKNVCQKTDYLVISAVSNPCWAYACYGRKVEQAVELRKQGFKLLLVHENDFLDAAQEHGVGI